MSMHAQEAAKRKVLEFVPQLATAVERQDWEEATFYAQCIVDYLSDLHVLPLPRWERRKT